MSTNRLSACVVQYGGAQETAKCLQSLYSTEGDALQVYLVDNASPDGSLQELRQLSLPKNVQILPQEKNIGFGAGHNVVLKKLQSEYHAVVNPDIVMDTAVISEMANWMDAHPDVVMVSPRLLFPNGEPQYTAKRRPALLPLLARQLGLSFLKKHEQRYLMLDRDLSKQQDIEFCSGCFFVIRTEVFLSMGGFDEGYFMYVEDADITQKALQKGRVVYLPQVHVFHAWHREAHRKPKQFFWQLKSMARYFKKWGFRLHS